MHIEALREYCLSKNGVEETMPFGPETLVYKVMGKVFLLAGIENNPVQFNVKCDPEKAVALREQFDCILPGYHMNKKHWNTVIVDGTLTLSQLKECIDDSYELIVSSLSKTAQLNLKKK